MFAFNYCNNVIPLEITWWSDESLIIVNSLFKVIVLSIDSIINLLGHSPEPGAAVTHGYGGQLLMLEGEVSTRFSRRPTLLPSLSEYSDEEEPVKETEEEEEEEEKGSDSALDDTLTDDKDKRESSSDVRKRLSSVAKQIMYFLTEREQFRPHKEKQKERSTVYRLVCLKSMPPEECYQRKIENEEYGEALELARQYNLDCDMVYQCQWQLSVPSVASIEDYLSKVSKMSWVLKECLHSVAPDFLTMKELLSYGLHRTSFKELCILRSDQDSSWKGIEEVDDERLKQPLEVIAKWKSLSEDEIFLCQCRETLLKYLDRLNTYEVILGGPAATLDGYDSSVFGEFRNINLIQAAIDFAKDGQWEAVEALFDRHGNVVLPYRLIILSYLPETISFAGDIQYLLPTLNEAGEVIEWEGESLRDQDWVEHQSIRQFYSLGKQTSLDLITSEEMSDLREYIEPITGELLTSWYRRRAIEIEQYTGQVDNALSLIGFAIKNNVKGLEVLEHQLLTLRSLVYHCNVDSHLSLSKLEKMTNLEILHLIMHDVEGDKFIQYFTNHAMPYIDRLMKLGLTTSTNLLEEFMIIVSKNDLRPFANLLKSMREKKSMGVSVSSLSLEARMSLALKCVYTCERTDQLDQVDTIAGHFLSVITSKQLSAKQRELYQQLNDLESFICAIEILASYNVNKSIKYIRDIKDNRNEAEQLFRRIVRVASRRTPPLTERDWRGLQQHLITLKNRVFHCMDTDTCMKIFTESLICSGSMDNISLATEALTVASGSSRLSSSPPPSPSFSHILPYQLSLDVAVKAAQEYFNSAAGPRDPEIELARLCLSLIKEESPSILLERNLIQSLELLEEFNIVMLPIKVRLCENKLDLIKQALDSSPTAYKKYDKLFRLSYLLGVSSERETSLHSMSSWQHMSPGRGHTAIYISLAALLNNDYKSALKMCQLLMNCNFPDAWEITKQLGSMSAYTDLTSRVELLNFSVRHCPVEEIKIILREKRVIEAQLLCIDCHHKHQMMSITSGGGGGGSGGFVRQLVGSSVQVLVSKGTGTVQQLIGQKSSMPSMSGKGHNDILSTAVSQLNELKSSTTDGAKPLPSFRLKYHPFYCDKEITTYSQYQEISGLFDISLNQSLYRVKQILFDISLEEAGEIKEEEEESKREELYQLLFSLSRNFIDCDLHMFTGYLLNLSKCPHKVKDLLSSIPPSFLLYHLSIYYCSLVLYNEATQPHLSSTSHPYHHSPKELINHVTSHVTGSDPSHWPESCRPYIAILKESNSLLYDYTQAKKLQENNIEFDIAKFMKNLLYKKETIISLARQGKEAVFDIALSLSAFHSVDKWELYIRHLDWLLTDSSYLVDEVNKRVGNRQIMNTLMEQPQKTADYLMESTYPALPSTRYSIIHCYFTYLQKCVDGGATVKEDISTHLKLLTRFKTTIREVNYHDLMSGDDPLLVLLPALGDHNIHPIAKLAKSIPLKGKGSLSPKEVYRAYAGKVFWREDTNNSDSYATSNWLSKFDLCRDYIQRLDAEQVQYLMVDMLFTRKSLQLMSLKTRDSLLLRLVEVCTEKKAMEGGGKSDFSFKDLLIELGVCKLHLECVRELFTEAPPKIEKGAWSGIVKKYDLSISETSKVKDLVHEMCLLSLPLDSIELILAQSRPVRPHKLTVKEIVLECLLSLVNIESPVVQKINKILMLVHNHEKGSGQLVKCSELLPVLESSYSIDSERPVPFKCSLLKCINQYVSLSDGDSQLLLFYQTQLVLLGSFEKQISLSDVASIETRRSLVLSLSKSSTSLKQQEILAVLLEQWPDLSCGEEFTECWLTVLGSIASDPDSCHKVVFIRAGLHGMNSQVDKGIFNKLWSIDRSSALMLSLLTRKKSLINIFMHKKLPFDEYEGIINNTVLELILYNGHIGTILNTPIYPELCSYLSSPPIKGRDQLQGVIDVPLLARMVQCKEDELFEILCFHSPSGRVERAVHQLEDEGFHDEAGKLLEMVSQRGTGSGASLMGVTSAFKSLKGFFS
ncbi:PREDICTED: neuroblastoma-amplified sequence-like [Amphimedon queenslandica]|uniref:Uncharacterized protein n=1 Tax=Amphimedon queenslandica TaxID=400682 RepID=A0A1X7TKX9_AMPQE|nr:PREDICTED: neuroblastoma-amplified sequence-like [Amphimedon queenslandica]|eukprot:XP_019858990.1 PREDICTED: neuroblastoma-amplified sequence-like [Amphimedon queenslandica]